MKDEIKEVLDKLKSLDYDEYNLEVSMDFIERKEEKILFDHITNLQETNKRLQNRNIELVLENDRLKENNNAMQEEMARAWEKLDKVKEYINTHYLNACEPYLLNIVNGDDKDVKD